MSPNQDVHLSPRQRNPACDPRGSSSSDVAIYKAIESAIELLPECVCSDDCMHQQKGCLKYATGDGDGLYKAKLHKAHLNHEP